MFYALRSKIWRLVGGGFLLAGFCSLGFFVWLQRQLPSAELLIEDGQWQAARQILRRYLKICPRDFQARILYARSLMSDKSLTIGELTPAVLDDLARIPNDSAEASIARTIEGRIYLLLLMKPRRAEACFLEAIKLDPNRFDAHALLWKLYDLTGRWFLSSTHFWKVYELSQRENRPQLLRDWYLSEFNPGTAMAELDRRWGVLGPDEQPTYLSERRRYEALIASELDSPVGFVCLARWFQRQGIPVEGLTCIKEAESIPGSADDPFVIATHVGLSIERGEFDEALNAFRCWPSEDTGYEFWKTNGLVCEQILHQNSEARSAYEKVISSPAGQSDWLVRHRLAQVLVRLGENEEAAKILQSSKEIERQMEQVVHQQLRTLLVQPQSPKTVEKMAEFYERISRPRESRAWRDLADAPKNGIGKATPANHTQLVLSTPQLP